ncbi:hypothetical protein C8F04DRAFT_1396898 [Mycena alexandri]|uniref:Phosphodiesterase n=1 Tax=Mycena alexandri TaxID=1745969 RepID=A0AAD6SRC9_9AGAR|nr:hypothetical protein C8F04DRAFT_1396898 [Mycena alexandri]
MCGHDQLLHPPQSTRSGRRRSADIGGLSLALGSNHGKGWLGHGSAGEATLQTRFAELLSDMYSQTLNAVNEHAASDASPDLPPETRAALIQSLDGWNFEPNTLPTEDHVAACAVLIFEALFRIEGMEEAVGVKLAQIPPFITHLRHIYRWQNSYHNFEHALDVLQATYSYLRAADMVPPLSILLTPLPPTSSPPRPSSSTSSPPRSASSKAPAPGTWKPTRTPSNAALITLLTPPDLLILLLAAIGHDVGHPGFTNAFMANAAAPLSLVFDGESPLERMHVALLLRVMRSCGLGGVLDGPPKTSKTSNSSASGSSKSSTSRTHTKRLLVDTVLATDMRVHDAFMLRFSDLLAGRGDLSPGHRRTVLCQAIIKCADISNPSRPYYISQHWASALLREWNNQAALESYHHLPPTVPAASKRKRAQGSDNGRNGHGGSNNPGSEGSASGETASGGERARSEAREDDREELEGRLKEASSQMFFIPGFVKPLLDLVVRGVPEMQPYAAQCDLNLKLWTARLANLKKGGRKPQGSTASADADANKEEVQDNDPAEAEDDDYTAFPLALYSNAFPLALPPAPEPPSLHHSHSPAFFPWSPPPFSRAGSTRPPSSVGGPGGMEEDGDGDGDGEEASGDEYDECEREWVAGDAAVGRWERERERGWVAAGDAGWGEGVAGVGFEVYESGWACAWTWAWEGGVGGERAREREWEWAREREGRTARGGDGGDTSCGAAGVCKACGAWASEFVESECEGAGCGDGDGGAVEDGVVGWVAVVCVERTDDAPARPLAAPLHATRRRVAYALSTTLLDTPPYDARFPLPPLDFALRCLHTAIALLRCPPPPRFPPLHPHDDRRLSIPPPPPDLWHTAALRRPRRLWPHRVS